MLNGTEQQARDFLEEQLKDVQHKIARLEHVKQTCTDCAEKPAGQNARALKSSQVIEELLARQTDGAVVPALAPDCGAHQTVASARHRPRSLEKASPLLDLLGSRPRAHRPRTASRHAWRDALTIRASNGLWRQPAQRAAARLNLRANPWGACHTATSSTSSAHSEDGEALAGNWPKVGG